MPTVILINLCYTVAAVFFILGLKLLGTPDTARRGNALSSLGMLLAVVVTLLDQAIIDYHWILLGIVTGTVIGALAARLVAMTAMPEMVALFNGFGGIASLLVGCMALSQNQLDRFILLTIFMSIMIGGVTFSGSLIAWGKL
ncbi:MAG: NAD synthetase, partial [Deltaproteobacteria bacterium]